MRCLCAETRARVCLFHICVYYYMHGISGKCFGYRRCRGAAACFRVHLHLRSITTNMIVGDICPHQWCALFPIVLLVVPNSTNPNDRRPLRGLCAASQVESSINANRPPSSPAKRKLRHRRQRWRPRSCTVIGRRRRRRRAVAQPLCQAPDRQSPSFARHSIGSPCMQRERK